MVVGVTVPATSDAHQSRAKGAGARRSLIVFMGISMWRGNDVEEGDEIYHGSFKCLKSVAFTGVRVHSLNGRRCRVSFSRLDGPAPWHYSTIDSRTRLVSVGKLVGVHTANSEIIDSHR